MKKYFYALKRQSKKSFNSYSATWLLSNRKWQKDRCRR
uniref:Uncharacterized protein n=1 Tax=Nelumbo nucifera TaxID=4432 RepID=A0A822ZXK0_NELNU|nr:TPA_asm: hypothetical protein HUJ06_018198 [Nelumbo nucifera]